MHHFYITAASLACVWSTVLGAPAPVPDSGLGSDPVCTSSKSYNVASQWAFLAAPKRETGASCTAGTGDGAGCSVAATFEHSVAITVDVGASLGLDFEEIFHAGIDASVSVTTENSESVSITENCPLGCVCSIQSVSHMHHVQGTQTTTVKNGSGPDSDCKGGDSPTTAPYSADFPVTDPSAQPNNQLVADFAACAIGVCKPVGGTAPPPCPAS